MTITRRQIAASAALAPMLSGLFSEHAWASTYPTKSVRLIAPFGPGNSFDNVTRFLADRVGAKLGQAFVLEPRQGAIGNIAASAAARSAPDGYSLLVGGNSTHAANIHLFKELPFDPVADFVPVASLAKFPAVLVVSPGTKANSLAELIALIKSRPGQTNFGSASAAGRVAAEAFRQSAGLEAVHVLYKTTQQIIIDLAGERLHYSFVDAGTAIQQTLAGKVRAIATTSAHRFAAAPDLPTMSQAGLPDFEFSSWLALFAPAKTPSDVIKTLESAFQATVRQEDTQPFFEKQFVQPWPGGAADLADAVKRETVRWGQVIKAAGIQPV